MRTKFLRRTLGVVLCLFVTFSLAFAAGKKTSENNIVDSGTFEIFVGGQRVASEQFQIEQGPTFSTATSELKTEDGKNGQHVQMQLSPAGDLQKYEWSEVGAARPQLTVLPQNEFLIEKIEGSERQKPSEHPYLLPHSTVILDDYFFSQRQILLWRYMASQCKGNLNGCQLKPTQFGVIVPRQQTSMSITVEYVGKEKIPLKGADRELSRFKMQSEGVDWILWADDKLKVQQMVVNPNTSDRVDVLRN